MTSIGGVLKVHCKCPPGIDGRCNFVASALFDFGQHLSTDKNVVLIRMSPEHLSLVSGLFQRNARGQ